MSGISAMAVLQVLLSPTTPTARLHRLVDVIMRHLDLSVLPVHLAAGSRLNAVRRNAGFSYAQSHPFQIALNRSRESQAILGLYGSRFRASS